MLCQLTQDWAGRAFRLHGVAFHVLLSRQALREVPLEPPKSDLCAGRRSGFGVWSTLADVWLRELTRNRSRSKRPTCFRRQ